MLVLITDTLVDLANDKIWVLKLLFRSQVALMHIIITEVVKILLVPRRFIVH